MISDPASLPLREIHLPESIGWWPPAPGWWILPCLVALAAFAAWYARLLYRRRKHSAVNMARQELEDIRVRYESDRDARHCAESVSGLLRRLCISVFPRADTAGLTGHDWLAFLQERVKVQVGEEDKGNEGLQDMGRILLEAPYRQQVAAEEVESLISFCSRWIETVATAGKSRPAGSNP